MGDNAGPSQPGDDAVGDVAGALRGAARHHQHVARRERPAHRGFEPFLIIGNGAEKACLTTVLVHGRRHDRAVGVVDRGRTQRLARLHQFVAGGQHRHARPPHDLDLRDPTRRQHADLPRTDHGAGAQQRLAARNVGTGIGNELPGRGGSADLDRARACGLGMLDHDDGIGAARHRPAGGDWRRRPRQHRPRRRGAAGDHFVVEQNADRRGFSGRSKIGRAHRKAIDIGAIERRHVDRRQDIGGQRAAERSGKRPRFAGVACGNSAASNRASASSRDRIVRNWSCSTLARCFGRGLRVISELMCQSRSI